jgi:hypothetical protein
VYSPSRLAIRNFLSLAFPDQLPLELSEGPHYNQEQIRNGGVFPGEGQVFFDEEDMDIRRSTDEWYRQRGVNVTLDAS